MKIAILGAGAMGMLFGGYLSRENEVALIDTDPAKVDAINTLGIRILEPDGHVTAADPEAAISSDGLEEMDLMILFVKAMDSRSALQSNQRLIGPRTYVISLQNGAGHDAVMGEFASPDRIVIGTTQHNSSIVEPGVVHHGGGGKTCIGLAGGKGIQIKRIAEIFNNCGIETEIADNIQAKIWEKLFVNASASALTAILQCKLGFLLESEHAWRLTRQLIREAIAVANAEGMKFEEEKVIDGLHELLEQAKDGYTSIYADIRDGRKTEVDTISGAVVAASRRHHVAVPTHEFVVSLIHAMEEGKTGASESRRSGGEK